MSTIAETQGQEAALEAFKKRLQKNENKELATTASASNFQCIGCQDDVTDGKGNFENRTCSECEEMRKRGWLVSWL